MADTVTIPNVPTLSPAQVQALVEMMQAFGFMNPYLAMLNPMQQKAIIDFINAFGLTWLQPIINVINNPTPTPNPVPAPPAPAAH